MNHLTPLSASLIAAGLESPLFRKRATAMSKSTYWADKRSMEKSIGGVAPLRKGPRGNRKQRRGHRRP